MVQLDYDFTKGRRVTIPQNLSWQAGECNVGGLYEIVSKIWDEVLLRRVSDGALLYVGDRSLAYLIGKQVPKEEAYKALNSDKFLPSIFECDYASEEDGVEAKLGFWYCAHWQEASHLSSTLLNGTWCYYEPQPFPWRRGSFSRE